MLYLHTSKQLKYFDEVIRLHYEEGYGEDQIVRVLPIGHSTVRHWIREYAKSKSDITTPLGGESYENLLKKARALYESGTSVTAISRIMGKSRTTIYKWIGIFAKEQEEAPMPKEKETNQKQSAIERCADEMSINELKTKLNDMEAALRKAELRADLYDEMINVAEAKFKISIRKKAGAKQ